MSKFNGREYLVFYNFEKDRVKKKILFPVKLWIVFEDFSRLYIRLQIKKKHTK